MAGPDRFPPPPSEEEARARSATTLARPQFPPNASLSYRAGHLAGLREAEEKARAFRERWCCAGGFGGHSAAARIIADTLAARIAELEQEAGQK